MGGFVMLQSYLAVIDEKKLKVNKTPNKYIILFWIILLILLFIITKIICFNYNLIIFGTLSLVFTCILEIINNYKISFTSLLINNYKKIVPKILIITLINALLHEIPNVFSKEWIYGGFMFTVTILNVPVIVLIGWIFLLIAPVIFYYLCVNYEK